MVGAIECNTCHTKYFSVIDANLKKCPVCDKSIEIHFREESIPPFDPEWT